MSGEVERSARLDAIACVRLLLAGDVDGAAALLRLCDDPREMAHAACGFTSAVMRMRVPSDQWSTWLDTLTAAAIAEGDS
jgi:hypothetical protein